MTALFIFNVKSILILDFESTNYGMLVNFHYLISALNSIKYSQVYLEFDIKHIK